MTKGYFASFEGGEGSGKSTICNAVAQKLIDDGLDVVVTREPGGSEVSEKIRDIILNNNMDPVTEALLFAAARRQHIVSTIAPALNRGAIVLSDRYIDSSLAYQGNGRGLSMRKVREINMPAITYEDYNCYQHVIYPNLTFFLDITPEKGLERVTSRNGEVNRLDKEKLDFHKKVYNGFKELALYNSYRYKVVDATKTIDEIVDEVYNTIKKENGLN